MAIHTFRAFRAAHHRTRDGVMVALLLAALALPLPGSAAGAAGVPHVLVISQAPPAASSTPSAFAPPAGWGGFYHRAIPYANAVFAAQAPARGTYSVEFTTDRAFITAETLSRFDAVVWNSVTGTTSPLSDSQEKAYEQWMLCGGAHVGIHGAADSWDDGSWPGWQELQGAFFAGHPMTPGSSGDDRLHDYVTKDIPGAPHEGSLEPEATLNVADPDHPANASWSGQSFTWRDEYYQYEAKPEDTVTDFAAVLTFGGFTIPTDENTVILTSGGRTSPGYYEDMPVAWTGSFRHANRTFYTSLGHGVADWEKPALIDHVIAGMLWTADGPRTECVSG